MTLDDVYSELLELVYHWGAQVSVPIESEEFFTRQLDSFQGSREEFLDYVRASLPNWYRFVNHRPRWIQEAEWQFTAGQPMVFIGQIDVPGGKGAFHDDAAFFVFLDIKTGETKTVIQVA